MRHTPSAAPHHPSHLSPPIAQLACAICRNALAGPHSCRQGSTHCRRGPARSHLPRAPRAKRRGKKRPRQAADTKTIKKAFHKLAIKNHLDKGGDPAVFQEISKARGHVDCMLTAC